LRRLNIPSQSAAATTAASAAAAAAASEAAAIVVKAVSGVLLQVAAICAASLRPGWPTCHRLVNCTAIVLNLEINWRII